MRQSFFSNTRIIHQENYVKKRMKDPDMIKLSTMLGSVFHGPRSRRYSDKQIQGYLRQEYCGTRKSDSYIFDADLVRTGTIKRQPK